MDEQTQQIAAEMVTVRQHHPHTFANAISNDLNFVQWCCHCKARRTLVATVLRPNPSICRAVFVRYDYTPGEWDHECVERTVAASDLDRE